MGRSLLIVLIVTLISAVVKPMMTLGLLILAGLFVYALFWPICAVVALVIAGAFVNAQRIPNAPASLKRARIRACDDDTPGAHGN